MRIESCALLKSFQKQEGAKTPLGKDALGCLIGELRTKKCHVECTVKEGVGSETVSQIARHDGEVLWGTQS